MAPLVTLLSSDRRHILCGNRQCQQWKQSLGKVLRFFDGTFAISLTGYQLDANKGIYFMRGRNRKRSEDAFNLRRLGRDVESQADGCQQRAQQNAKYDDEAACIEKMRGQGQGLRRQAKSGNFGHASEGGFLTPQILKEKPAIICCNRCRRINIIRSTIFTELSS